MLSRADRLYEPRKRTPWQRMRRRLGRWAYTLMRHAHWRWGASRWADRQQAEGLPTLHFAHATPLVRPLPQVQLRLQENKMVNLSLAARSIDGLVLAPGETFSFWRRVGRPSRRRGYLPGLSISDGVIGESVGGGLCQMGNLLYWMALHSPLKVVERWRHSFDVFPDVNRTLPFGSGATLAYNYVDLQLRNDTEEPIQLRVWVGATCLHGEIRLMQPCAIRYEVYEKSHVFRRTFWGAYSRHNALWRREYERESARLVRDALVVENHAILTYAPFLSENSASV